MRKLYLLTAKGFVRALLPIASLQMSACSEPKEVVAWPGMDVAEFNRLNAGTARAMTLSGTDWIGINSPVTLVFRHGGETLRFSETHRAGGMQIMSSEHGRDGSHSSMPRIRSISFNIGGSMEDLAEYEPLLAGRCASLARLAGAQPKPIPSVPALRQMLMAASSNYVEVCGGEGSRFTFQIKAYHDAGHLWHGGDYGRAYLNGYLGEPPSEVVR